MQLTDEQIKSVFLANGFTIKEGYTDLKSYVYQAARALLELSATPATSQARQVEHGSTSPAAPMVDMSPPATSRDRWIYEQGRLAERDARTPGSVAASEMDAARIDHLQERGATVELLPGETDFYPMRFRVGGLHTAPQAQANSVIDFPHEEVDALAITRYKVVAADKSMFWESAVVAGDGTRQLYTGRKVECENMARKFAGAFAEGAFIFHAMHAPQAQADARDAAPAAPTGWKWMTHPSRNNGNPIPVFTFVESGTAYYQPFDTDATDFEWDSRDSNWKELDCTPFSPQAQQVEHGSTPPAECERDVLQIIEKLPRYTYGYKSDEWGMGNMLRSYQDSNGTFLLRTDVLEAIAAQAAQQKEQSKQ